RHHQLVVLARAYRATGNIHYAEALVKQLNSWLIQCPFGIGMQWRSALELGVRLINWVWALDLIRESHLIRSPFKTRLLNTVYRHIWEVARKYSYGSSSNNHLIGEAAGVFIATSYFHNLKGTKHWRAEARRILHREMLAQTFADGGTREQALGYHLFTLQLFLLAGLVGRWCRDDFDAAYWERLEKMFEFLGALCEGGSDPPMFGDCDDGYVLELSDDPHDPREWLSTGAVLFNRPDLARRANHYSQTALWVAGGQGEQKFDSLVKSHNNSAIASRAFEQSGYYMLQCGKGSERISVVFDCGELGLAPLCAHGHADALSFTLRAGGQDVLVDPGTYDYFSYPRWRDYFRSTAAHNTVVIDGEDQSVMQGAFLWARGAKARALEWSPSESGGLIVAEHDGYTRLSDPVIHRRRVELDGPRGRIIIRDEIIARGKHEVAVCFHFSEQCYLEKIADGVFGADFGAGVATILMDARLAMSVLQGSEEPIGGWVSRGYHLKAPGTTLVGRCNLEGNITLISEIHIAQS
ncbi:MAG: heparinase II/III family protein, partial [Planctomycetota bacterium]